MAISALLSRILPPSELGTWVFLMSAATVTSVVAGWGLPRALVKLISQARANDNQAQIRAVLRRVGAYGVVGGAAATGLIMAAMRLWLSETFLGERLSYPVIALLGCWAFLIVVKKLITEAYRGYADIRGAAIVGQMIGNTATVSALVGIWGFASGATVKHILLVFLSANAISCIFGLWPIVRRYAAHPSVGTVGRQEIGRLALPIMLAEAVIFVSRNADIWILTSAVAREDVAIYGMALRTATLVAVPLYVMNAVLPPIIARQYHLGETRRLERTVRSYTTLGSLPSILLVAAIVVGGSQLLSVLFGGYYARGHRVVALLSIGQLINVMAGSSGLTLMMTGGQTAYFVGNCVTAAFTIIGISVAVRMGGIETVAAVVSVGLLVQNAIFLTLAKRSTGMWTHFDVTSIIGFFSRRADRV